MAKKKVSSGDQERIVKFSVYMPEAEHRRWTALLAKEGRKQAPVVVEWVREYLAGQKGLPEPALPQDFAQASTDELRIFSRLLSLYRRDQTTRGLVQTWIKIRK